MVNASRTDFSWKPPGAPWFLLHLIEQASNTPPIVDLQWALSDLELGYVRPSLKPPPHTRIRGNKPDNMQILIFKACCLKAALLLHAAGDARRKADATVINQVANAAKRLGVRVTMIAVGTYGDHT